MHGSSKSIHYERILFIFSSGIFFLFLFALVSLSETVFLNAGLDFLYKVQGVGKAGS